MTVERALSPDRRRWLEAIVAGLLIAAAVALSILFFERLPIEGTMLGVDWRAIWLSLRGDTPFYTAFGARNPPWILPLLWPLGLLSFRASWGIMTLITLGTLVVSVPATQPRWVRFLGILALTTSFLALRQVADGNIEALVIAGVLLVVCACPLRNVWAMAAGILLSALKLQETWLLLIGVGIQVAVGWPRRRVLLLSLLVGAVVVPSLIWLGPQWVEAMTTVIGRGSALDISLASALGRLGGPAWTRWLAWLLLAALTLVVVWRSRAGMSREKAGFLVSASLLLAPYAAGNSVLTVLAVGLIPLFVRGDPFAVALVLLGDLPYFLPQDLQAKGQGFDLFVGLLAAWITLGLHLLRDRTHADERLMPIDGLHRP